MDNFELTNKLFADYITARGTFAPALTKIIDDPQDREQLRQSQEGLVQALSEATNLRDTPDVAGFHAAAEKCRMDLNDINQILSAHGVRVDEKSVMETTVA